jgi:threonine dehydrogenase-like Zn-dependent dehydrogenase
MRCRSPRHRPPANPRCARIRSSALASSRFVVYYRRREFGHALDALARGPIDPRLFVTDRIPLDGIGDTFSTLSADLAQRKVLIRP